MGRKFIDCREYPSEMNCTLALRAGERRHAAAAYNLLATGRAGWIPSALRVRAA